jgi:hypothetical protein
MLFGKSLLANSNAGKVNVKVASGPAGMQISEESEYFLWSKIDKGA